MEQNPSNLLSQAVEREVRVLLGDLHMQVIVLRQMLEMAGQQPGQQPPQQPPRPQPQQPTGPKPPPDQPPTNPPDQKTLNGGGRVMS